MNQLMCSTDQFQIIEVHKLEEIEKLWSQQQYK